MTSQTLRSIALQDSEPGKRIGRNPTGPERLKSLFDSRLFVYLIVAGYRRGPHAHGHHSRSFDGVLTACTPDTTWYEAAW